MAWEHNNATAAALPGYGTPVCPDIDHVLDHLAGILAQVDDGKQDLPIGLAELLDDSRAARVTIR